MKIETIMIKNTLYISIGFNLRKYGFCKKEKNNYGRLLTGALDIHNFIFIIIANFAVMSMNGK